MRPRKAAPRSAEHPLAPETSLRREQRRLRRAFTALLVAIAPAAAVHACADLEPLEVPPREDAGPDVSSGADAGADASADAEADTDADASKDAGADAAADHDCTTIYTALDANADGEPSCIYTMPCGLPNYLSVVDCEIYTLDDAALGCTIVQGDGCMADADIDVASPPGAIQLYCPDCSGSGRRTSGLAKVKAIASPTALGAYFARMAHDEAASVHAFRRMQGELAAHGAPPALLRAAERAARDEERHARVMARRARLERAVVVEPRFRRSAARSLETIACENAVEGCVRETFGALVLAWQSARAADASLRRSLARIAEDETRHAALSWAVARWADERLDSAARRRVASARARALRALRRAPPASACDLALGSPTAAERALLLRGMIERLGMALH